jgi:hypothetical protein
MTIIYKITSFIHKSRTALLICLFVIVSYTVTYGQKPKEDQFPYDQTSTDQTPPVKDRLFFGGSLGLMFGTITDIQVSPVVGFWVLPRIAVAAGPTYRYYKDPIDKTALYGGRGYVQFYVIQDLNSVLPMGVHTGVFLHVEDELLSLKTSFWKNPPPYKTDRFYVNTVLAGAGISQQIGRRSSLNFMLLWPLNDPIYEIYSKPELRISFLF